VECSQYVGSYSLSVGTRRGSPTLPHTAKRFAWPRDQDRIRLAVKVVRARGHVTDADVEAVRAAGYSDGQVIEIVLHVALNTLTNYVNEVAKTEIDFPVVTHRAK
jgi:alkylhydroperoxidase family enzyme